MPCTLCRVFSTMSFLLLLASPQAPANAQLVGYDPQGVWPLCGFFGEADWNDKTDCDRFGDTEHRDLTDDTFGPRLVDDRYDWHRGIDMNTDKAIGRPVFAFTCGVVVEVKDSYINRTVTIRHFRDHVCQPNDDFSNMSCDGEEGAGCYYTRYSHLFAVESNVAPGDPVERGQLIGKTGLNCDLVGVPTDYSDFDAGNFSCSKPGSGNICECQDGACALDPPPSQGGDGCYEHLHFEVRDSRGQKSQGLGWSQRKAIHPLTALPYENALEASDMTVEILSVQSQPGADGNFNDVEAEIRVTIPDTDVNFNGAGTDLDLQHVEVFVYEDQGSFLGLVAQPNPGENYATPELVSVPTSINPSPAHVPYQVFPPYLNFVKRTLQYNYEEKLFCTGPEQDQDCTVLPFQEFMNDGAHESPYADTGALIDPSSPPASFPTTYNATTSNFHLERKASTGNDVGDFNGILVAPEEVPNAQGEYELSVKFTRLKGPLDPDTMCVLARAADARWKRSPWVFHGAACPAEITCSSCHEVKQSSSVAWTPRGEAELMKVPSEDLLRMHLAFLDAELAKR